MKTPLWQTGISTGIAKQIGQRRWSRRRTLAVSGAALLLLYAGLLFALRGNAVAAPSPALPAASSQPQAVPTPVSQPAPQQPAGNGSVSPTLLAEFDRLADNGGEVVREEFGTAGESQSGVASTMLFSLLLIVASIYGGVWLYKRYGKQTGANGLLVGGRLLAVQESQSIGPNQKLHLVRVGDELLLIGATDQNISFLARYDSEQANDSFADHLQSAITPDSGNRSSVLDLNEGLQRLRGLGRGGRQGGSNG